MTRTGQLHAVARREVRLSGDGGQGIILAGIILAEAALLDGFNVVQTQSYGPEARGGASKAEVVISGGPIDYPKVLDPDVVLSMSQAAADRYGGQVRQGGALVLDSTFVSDGFGRAQGAAVYFVPITRTVEDELGSRMAANIAALGALVAICGLVNEDAARVAVAQRVPKGTIEANLKALSLGMRLGREARGGRHARGGVTT